MFNISQGCNAFSSCMGLKQVISAHFYSLFIYRFFLFSLFKMASLCIVWLTFYRHCSIFSHLGLRGLMQPNSSKVFVNIFFPSFKKVKGQVLKKKKCRKSGWEVLNFFANSTVILTKYF